MNKLLIIDGNSLINRAFYAMPFLTNKKGEYTGAVFGFANMLLKVIDLQKPTNILVAFDFSRKTFRNEIFAEYKGTRKETPEELRSQFPLVKQMLDKMHITRIEQQGIEADDIIGTASKMYDGQVLVLTGDHDILQLLDKKTTVLFTKKGISEIEEFTPHNVKEKYGVNADQVVDLKALMGDTSDNIPGLAGVGPKTATTLIEKYGTLDNIFKNISNETKSLQQKFEDGKETVLMSKILATIKTDCQIDLDFEKTKIQMPFDEELYNFFEDMNFTSLTKRGELFSFKPKVSSVQTKILETSQDLQNLFDNAQKTKKLAFCTKDQISFAFDNTNYVLPKEMTLFSVPLSAGECLSKLKPLFEDENIEKFTYDLKSQLPTLSKNGINISHKNIFDYAIASYLVWAGEKIPKEEINAGFILANSQTYKTMFDELELNSLYNDIELPLTLVLNDMEQTGFKIDTKELENLKAEYEKQIQDYKNQIVQMAGQDFNVNSPKQLADVIFDKLGLKSYIDKKRSTNIEVLNELSSQHPIIPVVIKYRKVYKLYSTYVLPYAEIILKQGDLIKTIFNQTLTSTGRLSSSEPNLQNIPVRDEEGKNLRKLFVSRFEDGVIMSADYNQIELRLLASFSQDENMVNSFNSGIDIHTKTASEIFGVDTKDVTPQMRREAKAVNFGIVYGISDFGLATNVATSRKKAKEYIEKYFLSYPDVKTYQDKNIEYAKQHGMVKTLFGRIRRIPELKASQYMLRQFGERAAMNAPLQGSASDIIKLAMITVFEKIKQSNLKAKLILQIHDELILDVPKDEILTCQQLLKDCMENVVKLQVKLPVEVEYGKNWFYC